MVRVRRSFRKSGINGTSFRSYLVKGTARRGVPSPNDNLRAEPFQAGHDEYEEAGVKTYSAIPASGFIAAAALTLFAFVPHTFGSGSTEATLRSGVAAGGTPENPRVIQIQARQFEFVPNQITVKKGETVKLELTSGDVKHGFYIRGMKVDELIEPGKTTEITLTPQAGGVFPTICDHLCGPGHGKMKMTIVVEE
jgi:cytochrome c oxidase subunit II